MAAFADPCRLVEHLVLTSDRIQSESVDSPDAVTMTSVRWPMPILTTSVSYGTTGMRSWAMTVMFMPSMVKRCMPWLLTFMIRSLYDLPFVNRKTE